MESTFFCDYFKLCYIYINVVFLKSVLFPQFILLISLAASETHTHLWSLPHSTLCKYWSHCQSEPELWDISQLFQIVFLSLVSLCKNFFVMCKIKFIRSRQTLFCCYAETNCNSFFLFFFTACCWIIGMQLKIIS